MCFIILLAKLLSDECNFIIDLSFKQSISSPPQRNYLIRQGPHTQIVLHITDPASSVDKQQSTNTTSSPVAFKTERRVVVVVAFHLQPISFFFSNMVHISMNNIWVNISEICAYLCPSSCKQSYM